LISELNGCDDKHASAIKATFTDVFDVGQA
jgi:hypothetical protein